MPPGLLVFGKGEWTQRQDASWRHPGFDQGLNHPAVGLSWDEAQAFCDWLTLRERRVGLINKADYSLPTDVDWSLAIGLDSEPGNSPREKSERIKSLYPWGTTWPPPSGAGNFAGTEIAFSLGGF
jgi:formylglycine-generating enzyme required for sulfatase activity